MLRRTPLHPQCIVSTVFVLAAIYLAFTQSAVARISEEQAIEASEKKLETGFPWYDAESGDIAPVSVQKTKQPKSRETWGSQATKPAARNWDWPDLGRVLQVIIWLVLALIIGGLLFLFVRSYLLVERATKESDSDGSETTDIERMENLPFPVRKPTSDLLGEARRHYEAGNYADAIVYLFSYQLVQLDKNNLIRLTKGKTNRQYVRELRREIDLKSILSSTMLTFEDVFFGNYPLERSRFERCWNRLDEFHGLLEGGTA